MGMETRKPIDLSRIREAHGNRGAAMREPDANRRIITRAKVRTVGNLFNEARVVKSMFQSEIIEGVSV